MLCVVWFWLESTLSLSKNYTSMNMFRTWVYYTIKHINYTLSYFMEANFSNISFYRISVWALRAQGISFEVRPLSSAKINTSALSDVSLFRNFCLASNWLMPFDTCFPLVKRNTDCFFTAFASVNSDDADSQETAFKSLCLHFCKQNKDIRAYISISSTHL